MSSASAPARWMPAGLSGWWLRARQRLAGMMMRRLAQVLFSEALALWRGRALADVLDVEPLALESARREELAGTGHARA